MYPKEKEFANLLIKQGKKWIYEPKRFNLGNTTYQPDFYIPKEKLYIELVGSRQAYHINKKKIAKFKKMFPNIKFIIERMDFKVEPYYNSFIRVTSEHRLGKCGASIDNPKNCLTHQDIFTYWKNINRVK